MAFDVEAAVAARRADPTLTVFDTGEMLKPLLHGDDGEILGAVDFTDQGTTVLTVYAHESTVDDDTVTIQVDAHCRRLKIVVGDEEVWIGEIG